MDFSPEKAQSFFFIIYLLVCLSREVSVRIKSPLRRAAAHSYRTNNAQLLYHKLNAKNMIEDGK